MHHNPLLAVRFATAITLTLTLLVGVALAQDDDGKRKKRQQRNRPPAEQSFPNPSNPMLRRSMVQPTPAQTPFPPPMRKRDPRRSVAPTPTPEDSPGKGSSKSSRDRKPKNTQTPSPRPSHGPDDVQASTAGDKSAGKRHFTTPTPATAKVPALQEKAAGSSSSSSSKQRESSTGRPARTYPYTIKTPWGTVTIENPDQEPERDAKGEPIIEKPEGKPGEIGWVTEKGTVVRTKFTKEHIADIRDLYGDGMAAEVEDLNKRAGAKGVRDNLDNQEALQKLGIKPEVAAKLAEQIAKQGTGKGRDEAIVDAMIDQNLAPAYLKNTGRQPSHLARITEIYQDLGGTDPSRMPPEFVTDVENAKRKGNAAEVKQKWNDRIPLFENSNQQPGSGGSTAPGLTGSSPAKTRPGLIGGSSPSGGGLPTMGTSPFGPGGGGTSSGGSAPGVSSSGGKGLKPPTSWSERQANQADARIDRINQEGGNSGTSTSTASAPPTHPDSPPPNSTNPDDWRDGKVETGEITTDYRPPEDSASPTDSATPEEDSSPAEDTSPTPSETETEDKPAPGVDDPQGTYKGWNQGFHPGIAGDMSNLGPKRGGEKVNPSDEGSTGNTSGSGKTTGASKGKDLLTDPPKPGEPVRTGQVPTERPRGPNPNTVYPAPDAPDQPSNIPGDTGKLTDELGQREDDPKEPTGSSSSTATATPRRPSPGERLPADGKKSPTPTPTYVPGGQYMIAPQITPPPSASPATSASASP